MTKTAIRGFFFFSLNLFYATFKFSRVSNILLYISINYRLFNPAGFILSLNFLGFKKGRNQIGITTSIKLHRSQKVGQLRTENSQKDVLAPTEETEMFQPTELSRAVSGSKLWNLESVSRPAADIPPLTQLLVFGFLLISCKRISAARCATCNIQLQNAS